MGYGVKCNGVEALQFFDVRGYYARGYTSKLLALQCSYIFDNVLSTKSLLADKVEIILAFQEKMKNLQIY